MTDDKKTLSPSERILSTRRAFLRKAGLGTAAAASSVLAAPAIVNTVALGAHVIQPQIEAFNAAANGEMEI